MRVEDRKRSLIVAPFECAWGVEFRFVEAGRGCIAFEASAQNDVTLVFREQLGSQHYHNKMDSSHHYAVILGSHRNKRLKIEVDGRTVVDEAGVGLCRSSSFQSYWISIYDGLISIGQGRHPNNNVLFQWLDPDPNRNVYISAANVLFEDVSAEAFPIHLQFMYSGEFKVDSQYISPGLVQLLLLSDQFGITVLQFECCKRIMEFLSEDSTVLLEEAYFSEFKGYGLCTFGELASWLGID